MSERYDELLRLQNLHRQQQLLTQTADQRIAQIQQILGRKLTTAETSKALDTYVRRRTQLEQRVQGHGMILPGSPEWNG